MPGPQADRAVRLDKPRSRRSRARRNGGRTVRSLPLAWFPAAVLGIAALLLLGILVWFSHGGYWDKPAATRRRSRAPPTSSGCSPPRRPASRR